MTNKLNLNVNIDMKQLFELIHIMGENVALKINVASPEQADEEDITEFATTDPYSELTKARRKGIVNHNMFKGLLSKTAQEEGEDSCSPREKPSKVKSKKEIKEMDVESQPLTKAQKSTSRKAKLDKMKQIARRHTLGIAFEASGKLDVNKAHTVSLLSSGLFEKDVVEDLAAMGINSLGDLIRSNIVDIEERAAGKSKDGKTIPADPGYTAGLVKIIRQQLKQIGVNFKRRKYFFNY